MRERHRQLVITFARAAEAMKMDILSDGSDVGGRVIPLPSELSAGCGIAWKAELSERERLLAFMDEKDIRWEAVYEMDLY